MKFKSMKTPSAPTKDIGNGRTKDIAKPIATYIPIHFNWYTRNCLSSLCMALICAIISSYGYLQIGS